MLNSLDLLIYVFIGFAVVGLLGAVVLQFVKKDDKAFKLARILSAASVLGGLFVTFAI